MMNKHQQHAQIFKAFCDENRLEILSLLQSGEKCAGVLLERLNISQPTLSHHMKILVDSGVVTPRKEGKWTHYSIDAGGSRRAAGLIQALTAVSAMAEPERSPVPERKAPVKPPHPGEPGSLGEPGQKIPAAHRAPGIERKLL